MEKERDDLKRKLAECERESEQLIKELKESKIKIELYAAELQKCQGELSAARSEINNLNSKIAALKAEKEKCENDLDALRCETNRILVEVDNTSDALSQILGKGVGMNQALKKDVASFVKSNDIHCDKKPC